MAFCGQLIKHLKVIMMRLLGTNNILCRNDKGQGYII